MLSYNGLYKVYQPYTKLEFNDKTKTKYMNVYFSRNTQPQQQWIVSGPAKSNQWHI
jgi:hypothetical protein